MDWPLGWAGGDVSQGWSFSDVLAWGLLGALLFLFPLVVLFSRAIRRRRFWCVKSGREVEVQFEEHGLPGFRRQAAVKSCSAFDPSTTRPCGRECLDPACRPLWAPSMMADRLEP